MPKSMIPAHDAAGPRVAGAARLETFAGAAFVSSPTLRVISCDRLPDTGDGLHDAPRRVPVFVACFVLGPVLVALGGSVQNRALSPAGLAMWTHAALAIVLPAHGLRWQRQRARGEPA